MRIRVDHAAQRQLIGASIFSRANACPVSWTLRSPRRATPLGSSTASLVNALMPALGSPMHTQPANGDPATAERREAAVHWPRR